MTLCVIPYRTVRFLLRHLQIPDVPIADDGLDVSILTAVHPSVAGIRPNDISLSEIAALSVSTCEKVMLINFEWWLSEAFHRDAVRSDYQCHGVYALKTRPSGREMR